MATDVSQLSKKHHIQIDSKGKISKIKKDFIKKQTYPIIFSMHLH